MSNQPQAGEQRNKTVKRDYDSLKLQTADGGTAKIKYCSSELSVAEVYCSHCQEWVDSSPNGIFGFIVCPQCNKEYREAEKVSSSTT